MKEYGIKPVAVIRNDYGSKFGIPRQAGIVEGAESRIVFEKEFAQWEALRGIEEFSHLWLIWQFSENLEGGWSPTVRPPRLGGNERKGVFATRSPYRPNALGLSCVRLLRTERSPEGAPVLVVGGADLMDGTPIFDIKPYIPYSDGIPEASCGFAPDPGKKLPVQDPEGLTNVLPPEKRAALLEILSRDPRPQYQKPGEREYGMLYAGKNVRFRVDEAGVTVTDVENPQEKKTEK